MDVLQAAPKMNRSGLCRFGLFESLFGPSMPEWGKKKLFWVRSRRFR